MSAPVFGEKSTGEEVAKALKEHIVGKNVLLVGATVGSLGGEFLRVIIPYAKTVWVAGRNKERLQQAVDAAIKGNPDGSSTADIRLVQVDTTSFESIRAAATVINEQNLPLHVLVQNVLVPQSYTLRHSPEGHEVQFAGNHLGTFLLTSLLYPRLKQAGPGARVIAVSSAAHQLLGVRWDDPAWKSKPEEYGIGEGYAQSKSANIYFAQELAKRAAKDGILAYSLNPGAIVTNGTRAAPKDFLAKFDSLTADGDYDPNFWSKSIPQGISTYVVAAFDPSIADQSGAYLDDCVVHNDRIGPTITEDGAARCWALSEELVGIKFL